MKDFRPAMPLRLSPWAQSRWMVLAPHADDETLGAAALITDTAARGKLAAVVFLTDGSGSHPHKSEASRQHLIAERRIEAKRALRRLTGTPGVAINFLGWPDAQPARRGDRLFLNSIRHLSALCRIGGTDAIAVSASIDPHCDHQAACELAYAASNDIGRPLTVFEYAVWAKEPPDSRYRRVIAPPMSVGRRSDALRMHRSQLTPLFGTGFCVPAKMRRMPATDTLYTLRNRHA